jgi:large subunit ribosomal protein L25
MKEYNLCGKIRETLSKGALSKLRNQGMVPGNIYGKKENINCYFFVNDLKDLIYTDQVYIIHILIENKKYTCMIKEVQYHPLSDAPIHIDMMEVSPDKIIKIKYPLAFKGTPKGVMMGGKIFIKIRKIRIKGKLADIPETYEIDIAHLNIGDSIKVKDISIPNIEILESPGSPVLSVSVPRVKELVSTLESEEEASDEEEKSEESTE